MAATVNYQKVTHQEVIVKISGVNGESATIALETDLFPQGSISLVDGATISTSDADATVTGTNTLFTDEMIGGKIYDGTDGPLLGIVESVTSPTELELTDVAAATYTGPFGISYRMQEVDPDFGPGVAIVSVVYTGTGIVTIKRPTDVVMVLNGDKGGGRIDLFDFGMIPDSTNLVEDIVVAFSDASPNYPTQVWLKLRKIAGWLDRIETAYYGSHDDLTKVGQ